MDYCIACRRYLNGALACAGCGTPAEYLISAAPAAPAAAAFGRDPTVLADVYADSLVVLSGDRGQGRAAGRRRAHRRRRRTALTAGLGLLLAAGASLGLARLATDGERTDRAATVELTDDAGPREPDPLPGLTGAPAAPSGKASAKGPAARSAKATAGGTKQGGAGPAAGPSAPSSGAALPSRSATGVGGGVLPLPVAPVAPTSRGAATPGGTPTSKGPKPKPKPTPKPTPSPTPSPEPTPECSLWAWLCW